MGEAWGSAGGTMPPRTNSMCCARPPPRPAAPARTTSAPPLESAVPRAAVHRRAQTSGGVANSGAVFQPELGTKDEADALEPPPSPAARATTSIGTAVNAAKPASAGLLEESFQQPSSISPGGTAGTARALMAVEFLCARQCRRAAVATCWASWITAVCRCARLKRCHAGR